MVTPHDEKDPAWTGFAASIPGGGHIRHGIPCQDASAVLLTPRPAAIVCDGRGSASLSHFGAQGAVDAFRSQTSILEPFLVNILDGEEEVQGQWIKFCRIMYRTLMQVKYDLAQKHHQEEKEFDCTVAFAIAGKKRIGCFQVGDGSIVLRQNGVCKTVFLPEKGEFANQTHFLRPGGEEKMAFQHALMDAKANTGIAITSDGPEHLMFHLADMTPGRIFDMFFDDLRSEELCRQDLMDYLTRREWADDPRGSDDRSIALLARIGVAPAPVPVHKTEMPATPVSEIPSPSPSPSKPEAEAPSKPEAEVEVQPVAEVQAEIPKAIPTEAENIPRKAISRWPLVVMGSLLLGLLAETAYLVNQHQTIARHQMEIQCLHQQLATRKQSVEIVQPQELPHPEIPVPTVLDEEPDDTATIQSQPSQPVTEKIPPEENPASEPQASHQAKENEPLDLPKPEAVE